MHFLGNFNNIFFHHHCQIAWQALYKRICKYFLNFKFSLLNSSFLKTKTKKKNNLQTYLQYNEFLLGNTNITKWDQVEAKKKDFSVFHYSEIEYVFLDKGVPAIY